MQENTLEAHLAIALYLAKHLRRQLVWNIINSTALEKNYTIATYVIKYLHTVSISISTWLHILGTRLSRLNCIIQPWGCIMQYCNIVDCDLHLKTHCKETMCQSKLSQDIGSSITQRLPGNNLWESFSNNHICSDERVWPKIEKSAKRFIKAKCRIKWRWKAIFSR